MKDQEVRNIELAIVIVASNHNPTILNPDFLKRNQIVPEDWELAQNPVCTDLFSQVVFKSGVRVSMELDKVTFVDSKYIDKFEDSDLADIAKKFVLILKQVKYHAIGFNPRSIINFTDPESMRSFISEKFLKQGPWMDLTGFESNANLTLVYRAAGRKNLLTIEGAVGTREEEGKVGVLFRGNWHHDLDKNDHDLSFQQLKALLDDWKENIESFTGLVKMILES